MSSSPAPPPSRRPIIEVCLATVDDAIAAATGGADRIELNAALEVGGLTPSSAMLRAVRTQWQSPLITMIRPRPGNFCYSDREYAVLRADVSEACDIGVDGVAIGIIGRDGRIDTHRCREVVAIAGGKEVVFHRAFDGLHDQSAALETLIDCGVTRVLTSGGAPTAVEGTTAIAHLVRQARGRIEILPGAGLTPANVSAVVRRTGCHQVHGSFSRTVRTTPDGPFSTRTTTDPEVVAAVRRALHDADTGAARKGTG